MSKTLIVAHRGSKSASKFENTIESFQKAVALGADMIEFDLRKTADDNIVVFHNETISGYKIKNLPYQRLTEITSRRGFRAPLFKEVLDKLGGKIKFDIELKEEGYEEEVIEMVDGALDLKDCIITSFHPNSLKRIKALQIELKTGLLLGLKKPEKMIRSLIQKSSIAGAKADGDFDFILPHWSLLNTRVMKNAREAGVPIMTWTVNRPSKLKEILAGDVAGVITDDTELALELRASSQ